MIKDKVSMRLFLDILSIGFKDIINAKMNMPIVLKRHAHLINDLTKIITNPDYHYMDIILSRGQIELNVNNALILEHIFINIIRNKLH